MTCTLRIKQLFLWVGRLLKKAALILYILFFYVFFSMLVT